MAVVSTFSGPKVSPQNKLITKVCRLFGMDPDNDSDFNSLALDTLDEVVNDLNTTVWEFNRLQQSAITLTKEVQSYTVTTQFFREVQAYLHHTNDGRDQPPLAHLAWVDFKRQYGDQSITGIPYIYSTFNSENEGKVYLWPVPDTDTATDFTLTVDYYRRIAKISSTGAGNSIEMPEEGDPVLVYGAAKRIAILAERYGDADRYASLEREARGRLERIDRSHPDVMLRFRTVDKAPSSYRRRRGGLLIRVD